MDRVRFGQATPWTSQQLEAQTELQLSSAQFRAIELYLAGIERPLKHRGAWVDLMVITGAEWLNPTHDELINLRERFAEALIQQGLGSCHLSMSGRELILLAVFLTDLMIVQFPSTPGFTAISLGLAESELGDLRRVIDGLCFEVTGREWSVSPEVHSGLQDHICDLLECDDTQLGDPDELTPAEYILLLLKLVEDV